MTQRKMSARLRAAAAGIRRDRALADLRRSLERDFRFWAAVPALEALAITGVGSPVVTLAVKRPAFPRGFCRGCGCSTFDPCLYGPVGGTCGWTDRSQQWCTACRPAKKTSDRRRRSYASGRRRDRAVRPAAGPRGRRRRGGAQ